MRYGRALEISRARDTSLWENRGTETVGFVPEAAVVELADTRALRARAL